LRVFKKNDEENIYDLNTEKVTNDGKFCIEQAPLYIYIYTHIYNGIRKRSRVH